MDFFYDFVGISLSMCKEYQQHKALLQHRITSLIRPGILLNFDRFVMTGFRSKLI